MQQKNQLENEKIHIDFFCQDKLKGKQNLIT